MPQRYLLYHKLALQTRQTSQTRQTRQTRQPRQTRQTRRTRQTRQTRHIYKQDRLGGLDRLQTRHTRRTRQTSRQLLRSTLTMFLPLFQHLFVTKKLFRSDKDDSLVTLERFQEAFRDIGTACFQHLPPSTESTPCPPGVRGGHENDHDSDGQQSDAIFNAIVASVTG